MKVYNYENGYVSRLTSRVMTTLGICMLAHCVANADTLDLAGEGWRLDGIGKDGKEAISLPMRVPCDVQTVLLDAGKMENPFWGDNERRTQWPGEHDWTISREFDVSADFLANDSIILRLEDCDTFCTLKVNDEVLGITSNRFARYDFDVKKLLKPGRNKISGFFKSPEAVAMELAKQYTDIPYHMENVKSNLKTGMPLIRKPGCHGGWDWGLAQMTVGFCGKVALLGTKAARIDYVYCDQKFEYAGGDGTPPLPGKGGTGAGRDGVPPPSAVKVTVNVEAFAPKAGDVKFEVKLGDEKKKIVKKLVAGENKISEEFTVANPRLWWPAGHGEQNLYPLLVKSPDGSVEKKIGLRKVKLVTGSYNDRDVPFTFEINDRRIFAKGINWIPCDAFESRQEAKYRPLLESCREANMNMVRIWGGGQYERDSFYELCDALGLMVFHDFMFGCSRNPGDEWFLSLVEAETRHQIKRLRDVPSIVLWAGDNECVCTTNNGGDMGPKEDRERRVAHWRDCWLKRDALQAKCVEELDPARAFWPSSPCDGFGDPCLRSPKPNKGDHHTYGWQWWLAVGPRFCSEYGFQSYPSHDTALQFVKSEDVDPGKPSFAYHQKSGYGNSLMQNATRNLYRAPKGGFSPENKIYLSLYNQAWLVGRATEKWRTLMPHCMGTLIWQLNDNWPVASWSMVEYGGKWKPLMYEARRFFAPVAAVVTSPQQGSANFETPLREVVSVIALNDGPKAVNVKAQVRLMTFAGETIKTDTFDAAVEPNKSVHLKRYPLDELGTAEEHKDRFLVVDIKTDDPAVKTYQTTYCLSYPKNCNYGQAEVKMEAKKAKGKWLVELSTDKPAFGVWVNATCIAGEFDDNHFTLLPSEPRTIEFKPQDAATKFDDFAKSLTVKHVRQTY